MTNGKRITVVGAVLIGAGTLVVLRQVIAVTPSNPHLWGLARWLTDAEFPGLPMICLGGLLLFVAIFVRSRMAPASLGVITNQPFVLTLP